MVRSQSLQGLEDHIESLSVFPKNRENTWKDLPLEKLTPAAWRKSEWKGARIDVGEGGCPAVLVCLSCHCELLETETVSISVT